MYSLEDHISTFVNGIVQYTPQGRRTSCLGSFRPESVACERRSDKHSCALCLASIEMSNGLLKTRHMAMLQ
jgi:hypothetical protein